MVDESGRLVGQMTVDDVVHIIAEEAGEDALLNLLQDAFVTYGAQFKPEELMNTVWAFAELRRDTFTASLHSETLDQP